MGWYCAPRNRTFCSDKALRQHLQYAPAHDIECEKCDRSFVSEEALNQHLRDSPAHAQSLDCEKCDRSFGSEEALEQHLRDAPAHAQSLDYEEYNPSFGSEETLTQYLQNSRVHQQQDPDTPLDTFFYSFPTFDYDPSLSPAVSYAKLQKHKRWRLGDDASKDAWNRYQDALESELRMWFGAEDDLAAWHALCRAIGVKPLPQTCKGCEEV
ncbi:MAG: hypothetical protein Q9216_007237 [Gyalolechia sp. 2 TL-2023]